MSKIRKEVYLHESDVNWAKKHYPDNTLSQILARLLSEFRRLHGDGSPKVYAQKAAEHFHENNL